MAGHSKFKNIMHRKGAQDKKRARVFAKIGRELMVAAKLGGDDASANPRLRTALSAARAENMPKDNIERAIKKGAGGGEGTSYEEIRYEGRAPGGASVIVEVLTDNRNRTASEVRATFSKLGGSLGESNSVLFQFDRLAFAQYPTDTADEDSFFETALEAGAEDVASDEDGHEAIANPDSLHSMTEALTEAYGEPISYGLMWRTNLPTDVPSDKVANFMKFLDALEDNDDVQKLYHNGVISDADLDALDED
ncbi:MAG: YebC/PmpR family DNA-binding transcriptional regulator [Alphaproteobacteria bacterium]|nr:YebC/PmpR family DNA-binding transcriptional regulator [Alphaproteobacteria bacterium]